MLYPILQVLSAVTKLGFGAAAFAVSRRLPNDRCNTVAWRTVGVALLIGGLNSTAHTLWAMGAVAAGDTSIIYATYLRWLPAMNYSRHATMLALGVFLCALPMLVRRSTGDQMRLLIGASAVAGFTGGALGFLEGGIDLQRHYPSVALLDAVEMMLFFWALTVALAFGRMDRWLWGILALYAVRQAFNVVSFVAIAWIGVENVWAPSTGHIIWTGVVLWSAMLAMALHRLRLARRHQVVGGLLDVPGAEEEREIRVIG